MLYIRKEPCPKDIEKQISEIIASKEWEAVPDPAERTLTEPQRKAAVDSLRGFFDSLDKDAIRKALLKEQHGLCAYCMKRIDVKGSSIEHWKPQNPDTESAADIKESLDYRNMLCVWDGSRGRNFAAQTCDAHKGNTQIKANPQDEYTIDHIKYRSDGTIYSDDQDIDHDLNEVLNLNSEASFLKQGRAELISALQKKMRYLHTDTNQFLKAIKKKYETVDAEGKRPQYAGTMLYFVNKYQQKMNTARASSK